MAIPMKKKIAPVAAPAKKAIPTKKVAAPVAVPAKKGFPARKTGTGVVRKSTRKPLPIYKAPADFKPHFLLVQVATEKDGLLAANVNAIRYQGRFDREADDKKKFNLKSYDMATLIGIQARLSAVTFKANAEKKMPVSIKERAAAKGAMRLPANTTFQVLMRVGKKVADQSITTRVASVFQAVESTTGRKMLKELEKTDIAYRAFRKASRILPAAFKAVLMPPKRTRGSKVEAE